MEISLLKLIKDKIITRFSILCFLFFGMSNCNNNEDVNLASYLNQLSTDYGYKFYKEINLYKRIGIDIVDIKNINANSYPIYGFYKKGDIIKTQKFDLENTYDPINYVIIDGLLITTNISEDVKIKARTIRIIDSTKDVKYEYLIIDNFEYLNRIIFKYASSSTSEYENKARTYLEYSTNLSENQIKTRFPTFHKTEYPHTRSSVHAGVHEM
jgi:hypothetical protein